MVGGRRAMMDDMANANTRDVARALWFTAPRTAEVREEALASPGRGEILVRGIVSLVSPGTEMSLYRGQVEAAPDGDPATAASEYLGTAEGELPFPVKFAYQIVGEVEQAGAGSQYSVGDRVFSYYPHQDRFVVGDDPSLVFRVQAGLDPERAAFANLFCVAYNALLDCPVRIGDCVAVSGLGIIGSFAAHLARRTASRLVVVDPLPHRRERASWIGANAIVHPDDAADAIAELTAGRGVDVYIEASGATRALQGAIDATGQEGTIVVISYYGNREVTLRLSPEFHVRRQRLISSQVGNIGSGLQPRWNAERRMAVAMEELASFDIEALISHRVPFENAPLAYEQIDTRPDESLGVLLQY
jgi:2-desacetyl-2-hydroxyethyl bacteriochlorophyllide A dehydrogenase